MQFQKQRSAEVITKNMHSNGGHLNYRLFQSTPHTFNYGVKGMKSSITEVLNCLAQSKTAIMALYFNHIDIHYRTFLSHNLSLERILHCRVMYRALQYIIDRFM
jgi:hypothetical protein